MNVSTNHSNPRKLIPALHQTFPAQLNQLEGLNFMGLGGSGEIGKNFNVFFYNDQILIVDNGVMFGRNPDNVRMTDPRAFVKSIDVKKQVQGMVITHAHEDHVGAVAYTWAYLPCKLYTTPFTAHILRHKLKENGIDPSWVTEIQLNENIQLGAFNVEFLSLTHSIPEPNALVIRTPGGNIFHTGDWKIDPVPIIGDPIDKERIRAIAKEGVLALICDSTNVFEEGVSGSEYKVKITLERLIQHLPKDKRIVLACFSSNLARVKSAYMAGIRAGRKVCIIGKSLERMTDAAFHCHYFDGTIKFHSAEEISSMPPGETLIIMTGSQAEPNAALTKLSQGKHPCLRLESGDVVIFSSRVIPGNQEAISELHNNLARQGVEIIAREADVKKHIAHTFKMDSHQNLSDEDKKIVVDNEISLGEQIHVSGHAYRGELEEIFDLVKPTILIPVHGEVMHIYEHAELGLKHGIPYTICPYNGQVFQLTPHGGIYKGDVPTGRLLLEGRRLITDKGPIIQDRMSMLDKGIIFINLILSFHNNRVREQINDCGVFENDDQRKEWIMTIRRIVSQAFSDYKGAKRKNRGEEPESVIQASHIFEYEGDENFATTEESEKKSLRHISKKDIFHKRTEIQRAIQQEFRNEWGKFPIVRMSHVIV